MGGNAQFRPQPMVGQQNLMQQQPRMNPMMPTMNQMQQPRLNPVQPQQMNPRMSQMAPQQPPMRNQFPRQQNFGTSLYSQHRNHSQPRPNAQQTYNVGTKDQKEAYNAFFNSLK